MPVNPSLPPKTPQQRLQATLRPDRVRIYIGATYAFFVALVASDTHNLYSLGAGYALATTLALIVSRVR